MRSGLVVAALASFASATTSMAQVTPPPPSAGLRDPLSLPGDNLPPPLAATLAVPRPGATPPPPRAEEPPPPAPPLDLALKAAQAALAQCKADGFTVAAAVSDSIGGMVAGIQADGSHPGRIYNAMRKNLTTIGFGLPSSAVRDKLRQNDFATLAKVRPNMTLFPGAVPLMAGGRMVGAIAVSGGPAAEADERCAAAGAAAIRGELR